MVIFYNLLGVSEINAFIIKRSNDPSSPSGKQRRVFLKQLKIQLVMQYMKERVTSPYLTLEIRSRASRISCIQVSKPVAVEGNKRLS